MIKNSKRKCLQVKPMELTRTNIITTLICLVLGLKSNVWVSSRCFQPTTTKTTWNHSFSLRSKMDCSSWTQNWIRDNGIAGAPWHITMHYQTHFQFCHQAAAGGLLEQELGWRIKCEDSFLIYLVEKAAFGLIKCERSW